MNYIFQGTFKDLLILYANKSRHVGVKLKFYIKRNLLFAHSPTTDVFSVNICMENRKSEYILFF